MVEFGAKINLDAGTATQQVKAFSAKVSEASRTLKQFQEETKATSQRSGNIFRRYALSLKSADVQTEKLIKSITAQRKALGKLSDEEKKAVITADRLNQKYDESARNETKLLLIRKELRIVVAAGHKTQSAANAIYDREALAVKKTTLAYKEKQIELRKNNDLQKAQGQRLSELKSKYIKEYDIKKKVIQVTKELNLLKRKGLIDSRKHTSLLRKETAAIKAQHAHIVRLTSAQHQLAKAARLVSIFSRVLLGLYAAARIGTFIKDVEETAEKIGLLTQKLEYLTGDAGAYKKLFDMTQEVGIAMESANKIVTRFAIVTNKVYDIETLNEWTSTIIKSARATGTSTQEMSGALIQITQAMSAGRLMGDEYRSVTENLPLFTVALRDLFKDSTLSLKELSSQGLLTNKVLIQGFEKLKSIVAEFPDTTNTVGASIDRISSSWDNFLSKVGNTNIVKTILNELSEAFNEFSRHVDNVKLDENTEEMSDAIDNLREGQEEEISRRKLIEGLKKDALTAEGTLVGILDKRIKKEQRLLGLAVAKGKIAAEDIRVMLGTDDKSLKKDKIDADVKQVELETRANKELLKTLKLIESIKSGKTISKIRNDADLKRKELNASQIGFGPDGTNVPTTQFNELHDDINKNEKEAIAKREKTKMDGALRALKLKTDFNVKEIETEILQNSKIASIENKSADDILEIRSAAQARLIALNDSIPENDDIGISADEAERFIDALDAQRVKDIADAMRDLGKEITNAGHASANSLLDIELDKERKKPKSKFAPRVSANEFTIGSSKLEMDKLALVEEISDKYLDLKDNMISVKGATKEEAEAFAAANKVKLDMLDQELIKREEALTTDFMEEFDEATILQLEMAEQLIDVWDNVGDMIASGIGDAFATAMVDQQNFGRAMEQLMKQVAKSIISGLVQIMVQRTIMAITAAQTEKAVTASSVASAAATASAWASAAAAVNAATFGAAAAAGAVQLVHIAAVANAVFAPKAHSGLDRAEEGTMLLRRDEMVLDPGTSQKVRNNITNATTGGEFGDGGSNQLVVNISAIDAESFVDRVGRDDVTSQIWNSLMDKMNEEGRGML